MQIYRVLAVASVLSVAISGQSIAYRGGLLTNVSNRIPAELSACGNIGLIGMNAQAAYIIGRTCSGENTIYWSRNDAKFQVVARESQFDQSKLLIWNMPIQRRDDWSLPSVEVRSDGLYFAPSMRYTLDNYNVDYGYASGSGGSYRVNNDGKLESVIAPNETIIYTNENLVPVTAQVVTSSLPFPIKGGGAYFFLRTKSNNVFTLGIFSRIGTKFTLVLRFQISPLPVSNVAYGLGEVYTEYGITEAADGSLNFMQGWAASLSGGATLNVEWMSFDPKSKTLKVLWRYEEPILGITRKYSSSFPGVLKDVNTSHVYWSIPSSNGLIYIARAPNPSFNAWKWLIPDGGIVRGASDHIASYLMRLEPPLSPTFRTVGVALWGGRKLQTIIVDGEALPGGFTVGKTGSSFMISGESAPVSDCTMMFATYNNDGKLEGLWRFDKPCITSSIITGGQIVLGGKNLLFPGFTNKILIDGVQISGATITPDRIAFNSSGISGGEHRVQVVDLGGQMYSDEYTISVPVEIQIPVINSVVTATFEERPLAPGGLFSIKGRNLSSVVSNESNYFRPGVTVARGTPLPTLLGGAKVLIDGRESPLLFSTCFEGGDCQINAQLPSAIRGPIARIVIQRYSDLNRQAPEATSAESAVRVQSVSPVVFKGAEGTPLFQIADRGYQLVGKETPARPGETIVGYGTGFGPSSPVVLDGESAGNVLAPVASRARAWLKFLDEGRQQYTEAEIVAVASPQFVGVMQFSIKLPDVIFDIGTNVYIIIRVGDDTAPDLELPFSRSPA